MDGLLILLVGIVVLLSIIAFFMSLHTRGRVQELERRLAGIEKALKAPPQQPVAAETAPAPLTPRAPGAPTSPAASPTAPPTSTPPPLPGLASAPQRVPVTDTRPSPPQWATPGTIASAPRPAQPAFKPAAFNWELFMGVRLIAWLGGLALFLAAAFFVKYSFERDLIPPELRVAIGFVAGLGLVGGGLALSRKRYAVTAHTLCASGVVILYAVTFACRAVYHFPLFGPAPTFGLMVLITAGAFLLAVRLDAMVVAVLGMLGGFLTPILLSVGQDHPFGLFSYIALLDLGLMAVVSARRWDWLNLAAAAGTVLMQAVWTLQFFAVSKVFVAMTVFLAFDALYLGGLTWAHRRKRMSPWLEAAAAGLPMVTMGFALFLLAHPALGARPGVLAAVVFGADLCLAAIATLSRRLRWTHLVGGGMSFFILSVWTVLYITPNLLPWALGIYFGFALLHALFPVALQRRFPDEVHGPWGHLFPVLALVLVLIPMLRLESVSFAVWPVVLMVDLLAIGLAVLTASVASVLLVLLVTLLLAAIWMASIPGDLGQLPGMLVVVGGLAGVFGAAGLLAGRRILEAAPGSSAGSLDGVLLRFMPPGWDQARLQRQVPALSGMLPFLLLVIAVERLPLANPSAVFGMALLLLLMLLAVARTARMEWLPPVGLGAVFLVECAWHMRHFDTAQPVLACAWYGVFYLALALYPFLCWRGQADHVPAWIVSALAGPLHFLLIHNLTGRAWPNDVMGLLPALFALPSLAGLAASSKQIAADQPKRNTVLALFGGVTLLFISLIFPIQFERQWLTLAWALEGVALFGLYFRIPHPGLRVVGVALLVIAFARLAVNPAVLAYHPRSAVPILNWYLYTYGVVTVCLFAGARLLRGPDHRVLDRDPRPLLCTLGTVLAFLLMNIEIADVFTAPGTAALVFQFSGSFARDMTYSIAWALFALLLVLIGIFKNLKAARYAGLALLGLTLVKLFLHDLASLGQLYRVGALVGVAVVAILASFFYQRFLNRVSGEGPPPPRGRESGP